MGLLVFDSNLATFFGSAIGECLDKAAVKVEENKIRLGYVA
jgi:hypothetical protein